MIVRQLRTGGSRASNFFYYCVDKRAHLKKAVRKGSGEVEWTLQGKCHCELRSPLQKTFPEVEVEIPSEMFELIEKTFPSAENRSLLETGVHLTDLQTQVSLQKIRPQLLFDIADSS